MDKSNVIALMKEGVVTVEFTKVNGDYRKMEATLQPERMPEVVVEIEEKSPKKKSDTSLSVWDVNAEGWRSFRWDKLKTVNGESFA